MNPRWVIAKRELKGVLSERTILLAVVIQVVVAGFSGFLVMGLSALVDPASLPGDTNPHVGVVGGDDDLVAALREAGARVHEYPDRGSALAAFDGGGMDGLVLANTTDEPARVQLILPEGDLRATFTLVTMKNGLEAYERDLRVMNADRLVHDPVYVDTDARAGSYAFVYGLLIPLLVFLPVVLAGALVADSVAEEMQRGTLPLLLVTPATAGHVVDGKLLANAALAPVLAVAWFALLALNDLPVDPVGGAGILVLAFTGALLLGLLACAIALFTRERNKAHVTYAAALMLLFALTLALPASPVNAVARLAAGSADAGTLAYVAASGALALLAWVALHVALTRLQARLASGTAGA